MGGHSELRKWSSDFERWPHIVPIPNTCKHISDHPTSRAPEFVVLNAKHAVRSDGVRDDIIGDILSRYKSPLSTYQENTIHSLSKVQAKKPCLCSTLPAATASMSGPVAESLICSERTETELQEGTKQLFPIQTRPDLAGSMQNMSLE